MELVKGQSMPMHTLTPDVRLEVTKALMKYLIEIIGVDVSKNPLKVARVEQMIEENARRMTPEEIKKAFDMYVNGRLQGLEPISGLLDSITFNKVVNQYKQQRLSYPMEEKLEISEEEKELNEYLNIIYAYDEFKQQGFVSMDYHWVYDSLKKRKKISPSELEIKELNDYLRDTYPNFTKEKKQKKGKVILVENYFRKLKKHIKDYL